MKIDQIAYYATSQEQELAIKKTFGLQNAKWIEDFVEGNATVYGNQCKSLGRLQFNYDLGIELEILMYEKDTFHWHKAQSNWANYADDIHLSHVGIHLDDDEDFPAIQGFQGWHLVQELFTTGHTNPYVVEKKRRYHYKIYQNGTAPNFLKYIKRLEMK